MENVLLDELPTSWNGYEVNTWYQIGVQLSLVRDDPELSDKEKAELTIELLFSNDDGTLRDFPHDTNEFNDLIKWFLNGWFHDRRVPTENDKKKLMDYDVDQFRIYADFLQIYHIDLSTSEMHWWLFNGLLWNMPHEQSSFMQVLDIRTKKPRKKATAEEKKAISEGHRRFDLRQNMKAEKQYTKEEEAAIDAYDQMMAEAKAKREQKKQLEQEALKEFNKH